MLLTRAEGRRDRAIKAIARAFRGIDLGWCAASLVAVQLYVLTQANLTPDPQAVALSVLVAAVPAIVLLALTHGRLRAWAAWTVAAAGIFVALADLMYFRYFGDVMATPALFAWGQAGQISESAWSVIVTRDLWMFANITLAAAVLIIVGRRHSQSKPRAARALLAAILLVILLPAGAWIAGDDDHPEDQFRNLDEVDRIGLFAYHVEDAWRRANDVFRFGLTDRELEETRRWFAARAPRRAGSGPSFGAARGRNLIVIQVESLQGFVLDFRINGVEVTPNLNRWKNDALRFSNVTDQSSEGRTSDGEFTSLVSLLPLDHGAVVFRHPGNRYAGLPRVLGRHGYTTVSAVAFDGGFWNRRVMHPRFGFDRQLFIGDFIPGENIGWGLNDRDFLAQTVPMLAALPKPFGAWLITLSLHHPFADFPDHHKELAVEPWGDSPLGNYLHAMRYFDRAFGEFVTQLGKRGLLEDTALVVLGDHDAGLPLGTRLASTIGLRPYLLGWTLGDEVVFLVRVPGNSAVRGEMAAMAGQTDVAPTLLALLGIDPAPYAYIGRNLLGDPGRGVVVRPYGGWVDGTRLLMPSTSDRGTERCFDIPRHVEIAIAECAEGRDAAAEQIEISRRVVRYDLQEDLLEPARAENTR